MAAADKTLAGLRHSIKAGGKTRYEAMCKLDKLTQGGLDARELMVEVADAALDMELGTYRRAYWIFYRYVAAGVDIIPVAKKLFGRALDNYRGSELRGVFIRFAEKGPEYAERVLAEFSSAYGKKPALDWIQQIELLAKQAVKPTEFSWGEGGNYGVEIGGGSLSWFHNPGGGRYSQSYTEFLEKGPKGLWIDRGMPEATRQKIYELLGGKAPQRETPEEKIELVEKSLETWREQYADQSPCAACKEIGNGVGWGKGWSNEGDYSLGDEPAHYSALKELLSDSGRRKICGCTECGRLYKYEYERDNMVGYSWEESHGLQLMDAEKILNWIVPEIIEGEHIWLDGKVYK